MFRTLKSIVTSNSLTLVKYLFAQTCFVFTFIFAQSMYKLKCPKFKLLVMVRGDIYRFSKHFHDVLYQLIIIYLWSDFLITEFSIKGFRFFKLKKLCNEKVFILLEYTEV